MHFMNRFSKLNTLRNQILVHFSIAMIVVLLITSLLLYYQFSKMTEGVIEKQLTQTSAETNAKIEARYEQIDTLVTQLATDEIVQQSLKKIHQGQTLTSMEENDFRKAVNRYYSYVSSIYGFQLFSEKELQVYPYSGVKLTSLISREWIERADEAKGKLVWIGRDTSNKHYSFAIKSMRLINDSFRHGGYLIVRVANDFFEQDSNIPKTGMMLYDSQHNLIAGKNEYNIHLEEQKNGRIFIKGHFYYLIKHTSESTGWTLVLVQSMDEYERKLESIGNMILIIGAVGILLFLNIAWIISSYITTPIHRLTRVMKNAKMDELKPVEEIKSYFEIEEMNKAYNQMVKNTNYLIQIAYEKELLKNQTELKALQSQINPHFLYNTLNAFYWSLEEKGEEELAKLVIAMSELFRYTVGTTGEMEWVSIQQELDYIERYLQLMQMRMGDRLQWEIECDDMTQSCTIPKLLIQPLVENAIVHGIEKKRGPGKVTIRTFYNYESEVIQVEVCDNGKGMNKQRVKDIEKVLENPTLLTSDVGIGIRNIQKRISVYYMNDVIQPLRIESEIGKGTCLILQIPIKGGAVYEDEKHFDR